MDENKTRNGLAECVNRIAGELLGCREGSEDDILERISELQETERKYLLIKNKSKIVDAIDNLKMIIDEIENQI